MILEQKTLKSNDDCLRKMLRCHLCRTNRHLLPCNRKGSCAKVTFRNLVHLKMKTLVHAQSRASRATALSEKEAELRLVGITT